MATKGPRSDGHGKPARILLVEDDLEYAELCKTVLVMSGYEVETAFDGSEALDMIRRERPDVMLTDVRMPRMSGLELLRELHADPSIADVPAVVLSNYDDPAMVQEARRLGALQWIEKVAVTPRDLVERLPGWLRAESDAAYERR
jgi:CheY-like chemotaxis protein